MKSNYNRSLTAWLLAVLMFIPVSALAQGVTVDTMKVQLPEGWSRPTDDPTVKAQQEKVKEEKKKEKLRSKKEKAKASFDGRVADATARYQQDLEAGVVHAPIRYCTSFQNFLDDQWVTLDKATVQAKGNYDDFFFKTALKVETESGKMNEVVKSEAFFLMVNDTMYVNMRKLKGPDFFARGGFARAYRVGNDKVVFGASRYPTMVGGDELGLVFMFGAVVGTVAYIANDMKIQNNPETSSKRMRRGFVITGDNKPIQWMNEDYMSALLGSGNNAETLISEYQSIKNERLKQLFTTQLQFLDRAGLLSPQ